MYKQPLIVSDYKEKYFGIKYGTLIDKLQLLRHSVFVLDKDNTIKYTEYVNEVVNELNYEEAIKVAKALIQ